MEKNIFFFFGKRLFILLPQLFCLIFLFLFFSLLILRSPVLLGSLNILPELKKFFKLENTILIGIMQSEEMFNVLIGKIAILQNLPRLLETNRLRTIFIDFLEFLDQIVLSVNINSE